MGSESVKIFGEAYFGIISAILTLLILVLSEIIPKTIGASYWRTLAIPSARIIRVLIVITYPLVWFSELLTKCFAPRIQPLTVSRDEVAAMVNVGADEGVFQTGENRIIQNFLKLVNVTAKEVMTPYVVVASVSASTTMKEFYSESQFSPFSRIPVYNSQREFIVGYARRATVLEMLAQDKFSTPISEITRPILSFTETDKVSDIWEKMLANKEHISVITDEYGCMRGIVTMEDVCDTVEDLQEAARQQFKKIHASHESASISPRSATN